MNWIKNKLLAALVSKYGPLVSGSISTAVGSAVAGAVTLVQAKVSPALWEWIVFVFRLLPDDMEARLTPEVIGAGAGLAFYAVLQEWLNQRQAGGIKAVQENHNLTAAPDQKIAVDGVAYKKGETVQAVKAIARQAVSGGLRSRRGHALGVLLFTLSFVCLVLAAACAPRKVESKPAAPTVICRVVSVSAAEADRITASDGPALPTNYSGNWLQEKSEIHTVEYNRPAWQRLMLSIRPWAEVGGSHAKVRVDENAATLSGSFKDDEKPRLSDMKMPDKFGIGFGGGLEL